MVCIDQHTKYASSSFSQIFPVRNSCCNPWERGRLDHIISSSPALLHMQSVSSSTTRFNYIPIRQINLCLFSPPLQYPSKTITFVNDFLKLLQRECSSGLRCFFNFYSSGIHWPHICFRDHLLYMKHSNYHS